MDKKKHPEWENYLNKFNDLRTIFDNLPQGVIVLIDASKNIVAANKAISDFLGLERENIIENNISRIFKEELAGLKEIIEETIVNKRPVKNFTFECNGPDGFARTYLVNSAIIKNLGTHELAVSLILHDISEVTRLRKINIDLQQYGDVIGKSPKMQDLFKMIETVKDYNTTILIMGETGTGKEVLARAIHLACRRSSKPFVAVQCSALPETLLESEIFGHVKGAFTGAVSDKMGRFELANGGTLFLDEVGTLSNAAQIKLLRALQQRVIEPVGSNRQFPIDVRIISATNRDLTELVSKGEFRADLYYRLKVIQLNLPPLRERKIDIPILIDQSIARLNAYYGKNILGIASSALDTIMKYVWPGNIRELENAIEHAFVMATGAMIEFKHLPPEIRIFETNHSVIQPKKNDPKLDEENIRRSLIATQGNMNKVAEMLQMHRATLWRRMREFGIKKGFGKSKEEKKISN